MNRKMIGIAVTAVLLGLMLFPGMAAAGRVVVPVSGTHDLETIDPGEQWIDDDGITHYRGLVQAAHVDGQDDDGVVLAADGTYTFRIAIDMESGNGWYMARMMLDMSYGDREGTMRGVAFGTFEGFLNEGRFCYYMGSGDFHRWRFRGTVTGVFAGETGDWDAVFVIPGGRGGDKAAAIESETWSGVKDLFR